MDLGRIARIRAAIPNCPQPFDVRAVSRRLDGRTKCHEQSVRNGLYWLCRHGELARHIVKKGRRRKGVVFTMTAEFGQHKTSPERILAAMARLDAAMRRARVALAEIRR